MIPSTEEKQVESIEIEPTDGLKSVDTFDKLGLHPDLLRGVYGKTTK